MLAMACIRTLTLTAIQSRIEDPQVFLSQTHKEQGRWNRVLCNVCSRHPDAAALDDAGPETKCQPFAYTASSAAYRLREEAVRRSARKAVAC